MSSYFTFNTISLNAMFFQFAAATLLPLAIGLERYLNRKPIDFRPYVIISVVACGIFISTNELASSFGEDGPVIDPTRVMQGVITGIGFLGAGAMFRDGDFIKGAGSAASIWSAGVIGLICGIGEIGIALIMTVIILVLMLISAPFTAKWDNDG